MAQERPLESPTSEDHTPWHRGREIERRVIDAVLRRSATARNVNDLHQNQLTTGQRIADAIAGRMGSWPFIIIQSTVLLTWIVINSETWSRHWDTYPFILLNLALSFQAAYAAPIIMMSQNRQAAKDRLTAEQDYQINLRSEIEIAAVRVRLDQLAEQQWDALLALQHQQVALLQRIESLTANDRTISTDS
jgi:uncharacterized membrane protein